MSIPSITIVPVYSIKRSSVSNMLVFPLYHYISLAVLIRAVKTGTHTFHYGPKSLSSGHRGC